MIPHARQLAVVAAVAAACSAPPVRDGTDRVGRAAELLALERPEEALELVEPLVEIAEKEDDARAAAAGGPTRQELAEATWIAAEAQLALGEHLAASRGFKRLLERYPWSPRVAVVERRLFDIGRTFLQDERYGGWFDSRGRGIEVLETLQIHFSRGDLADDALKLIADHYASEEVGDDLEAALTYEDLYREYPQSEWAERALYLAGVHHAELQPGPEYVRDRLLRARELLELSLEVHPQGMFVHEVRRELAAVRETLARCELSIADFYAARGRVAGEQVRLANAAILYPETEAGREATDRLRAAGLDPDVLADDPSRHSVATVNAIRSAWDDRAGRDDGRGGSGGRGR